MALTGKSPVKCMDCHEEATINVESLNPQCLLHATACGNAQQVISYGEGGSLVTCLCGYAYNPVEWDRCPDYACPFNSEGESA